MRIRSFTHPLLLVGLFVWIGVSVVHTSALVEEQDVTMLAKVVAIESSEVQEVPNTDTTAVYQTVRIMFLSGDQVGTEQTIENSVFSLQESDKVYVRYLRMSDGSEYYSVQEPYRLNGMLYLFLFFIVCVLLFAGKQGLLSLISLFISFGVIFKLLFPSLLHGGNVVIIATVGALLSLFVVMYVTHGFTRLTTSAFLGCTISVLATVLCALYAVGITKLTGFASEESVYLHMATKGSIDFVALLIGGIIIGVIGVIDDVSITQASVVQELASANQTLSRRELYIKALKVGKAHMGSVINTLILAYAGASLPVVLLLYLSDAPFLELINREMIATEIVRSIVGSVGLILAVPMTTLIAVLLHKGGSGAPQHTHHHH